MLFILAMLLQNLVITRSSAVLSIGAATLADIFDPAERGRKVSFKDSMTFTFAIVDLCAISRWDFTTSRPSSVLPFLLLLVEA